MNQIAVTADLGCHAAAETAASIDVYTPPFGVFSACKSTQGLDYILSKNR